MAKQSGIHQLRGKVGEHSYYRQTGVSTGLVRAINQGMSARVKNGEEYANTRLNNAEFGQACRIAGVLGKMVIPKYRPMILPFSQSKMAALILEALKSKTGNWGERNLSSVDVDVVTTALNSVSKNDFAEYGISFYADSDDNLHLEANGTQFTSKKEAIGADGYFVSAISARPWIGTYIGSQGKYAQSFARINIESFELVTASDDNEFTANYPSVPPTGWPAFDISFMIIVVMPYRTINSVKHILQESCTFFASAQPIPD